MASATIWGALLGLVVLCFPEAEGGDYCYTDGNGYYFEYCSGGCCGSFPYENCCPSSVGIIVGCVIGGIFLIAGIVTLVCCCIKKQGYAGRVVHPATQTTNGVATMSYGGGATTYGLYPQQPPASQAPYGYGYGTQAYTNPPPGNPPPAYSYSDPAYPSAPAATQSQPYPPGFKVN